MASFDEDFDNGGILGSPAIYKDIVIFDTDYGDVIGLDRKTGEERWRFHLPRTWSSPVVVDDVLFIGDCTGNFYAYDVADTRANPTQLWGVRVGGCVELASSARRSRPERRSGTCGCRVMPTSRCLTGASGRARRATGGRRRVRSMRRQTGG